MIYKFAFLVLAIITLFLHIFGKSSQTGTFFYLAIFFIADWLVGLIGSILIGLGGAPGALFAGDVNSETYKNRRWAGLFLSFIGQSIVAIIFVALTVVFVKFVIFKPNTSSWILWIAGFIVAISPVKSAAQQSKMEEKFNPEMVRGNVLHMALGFTCIVAPIAYIIFAFFPKTMWFLSWF